MAESLSRLLHPFTLRLALAATAIGLVSPALADSIDGNWCNTAGNKQMQISGTMIVTPGGKKLEGRYSRHTFAYVVPDSEAPAGDTMSLQLMGENRIIAQVGTGPTENWHRCEQTS